MPKIINDLKEKILASAKPLIFAEDYDKLTMRSIANSCQVAVGTIYNYFPSKDVLFAHIILEDWVTTLTAMKEKCGKAQNAIDGLADIFSELCDFIAKYRGVWENAKNAISSPMMFRERHTQLIDQIAEIINGLLHRLPTFTTEELPVFLAETMLSYANAGKNFENLKPILQKLLQLE